MKLNQSYIVSTAIGVLIAGLVLRFGGNMPGIRDARLGFDGRSA